MRVIVWGCGDYGYRIIPKLVNMNDVDIVGYTDSNPELWGKKVRMFTIYEPAELDKLQIDQVLIAINNPIYSIQVRHQLINMDFPESSIIDIFTEKRYFGLLCDQRINFISDYAKWIDNNNIEGAVAECGVFRGDSAKYINCFFKDRDLYLCDTFEGFNSEDLEDEMEHNAGTFLNSRFADASCFAETSIELVLSKMLYEDKVIIKKGYFPETMKDVEEKFAFVNLDMDLYIPMLEGLRYFWGRMSKNGCILLHDYFSEEFERVSQAVKDFEDEIGKELIKLPIGDGCSLALICQ